MARRSFKSAAQMPLILCAPMIDEVLATFDKKAKKDPTLAAHLVDLHDMADGSRGQPAERILFTRIKSRYDRMLEEGQAPSGQTADLYKALLEAGKPFYEEVSARAAAKKGEHDPFVRDTREHPHDRVLIQSMRYAPRR